MVRFLAAFTVLLLLLGLAPLTAAHAETAAKGEALGILVLVGLLRPAAPSSARAAAERPKPSLRGALKVQGRAADVKNQRPAAKDGQERLDQLVRVPR